VVRHIGRCLASMVLLTGCDSTIPVGADDMPTSPYDGPMSLPLDSADDATVLERSGAAERAVECDGKLYQGGGGSYDTGLATVQSTAEQALDSYLSEEGLVHMLPAEGYRVEREDDGRVLLSYDVDDRTKVAFIVAGNVRDWEAHTGWGVESWAQCDPAELPDSVTEALDIGVWEDGSGARVPVTTIKSLHGAEHCGWQDITFLLMGPEENPDQYVRDTSGELAEHLWATFDADAELPGTATDTGFHRNGWQLWLGDDGKAAYLVSLDVPDDVERWPTAKQPIWCA
jgi:hypothetical protein